MNKFMLKTPIAGIQRKSWPVSPAAILDPMSSGGANEALDEGEWLEVSSDGKSLQRKSTYTSAGAQEGTTQAYPLFVEKGRYDTQVQSTPKATFLTDGPFIAETYCVDTSNLVVGSLLSVQNIIDPTDGISRRGLALRSAGLTVGRVLRIFSDGRVRFQRIYG